MCVICVSNIGVRQPNKEELTNMFKSNPHGAGYMYARDGKVHIHKGFMTLEDFLNAIKAENFTENDSVVYHTRISTQAGCTKEMTHPYPLTKVYKNCTHLDLQCQCGIAHNGVIMMTSNGNPKYNDTTIFIVEYMTRILKKPDDLKDKNILTIIQKLTNSKWAIMDSSGYVATIGDFIKTKDNLLFSNSSYLPRTYYYVPPKKRSYYQSLFDDDYDND